MSPSYRVLSNALALTALVATLGTGAARAQFYEPLLRSLDLSSDVSRSPRLLGMGGLSLVIPDRDQSFSLWNFADSPIGAGLQDSVPTVDLKPSGGQATGGHDTPSGYRELPGGHASRTAFEAFERDKGGNAWGAAGELSSVRRDEWYSQTEELRRSVMVPKITPILTGPFPYFGKGKLLYAVRLRFGDEHLIDQYRTGTVNAAGQFLSLDGTHIDPPNYFNPADDHASVLGAGVALAVPLGASNQLALGFDGVQEKFLGTNDGGRWAAERREKRPYGIGQATLVGHLGKGFEYGVDGRGWLSNSEQSWVFSVSAGVGAEPLQGRGKLLTRQERGSTMNARARWELGGFTLAGAFHTAATKLYIHPPGVTDQTSLNYFLDRIYHRAGADTLALPDSVSAVNTTDFAWGYGVGISHLLLGGTGGVEFHWSRDLFESTFSGEGPKQIAWDVRAGYERPINTVLSVRGGYHYRWQDLDDFTRLNEYRTGGITFGLGLRPVASGWDLQVGYALDLMQSDFGDPTQLRAGRQMLATQIHCRF